MLRHRKVYLGICRCVCLSVVRLAGIWSDAIMNVAEWNVVEQAETPEEVVNVLFVFCPGLCQADAGQR